VLEGKHEEKNLRGNCEEGPKMTKRLSDA